MISFYSQIKNLKTEYRISSTELHTNNKIINPYTIKEIPNKITTKIKFKFSMNVNVLTGVFKVHVLVIKQKIRCVSQTNVVSNVF